MAQKTRTTKAPGPRVRRRAGERAATSARTRSKRWTTRTSTSCAGTSRSRARSATAVSRVRAAATSGRSRRREAGPRDGTAAVRAGVVMRSSCSAMSSSSASRARSSTSSAVMRGTTCCRGGSPRSRRRVGWPRCVGSTSRACAARGPHRRPGRGIGDTLQDRAAVRGEGRPDRARCSARSRRPRSPRSCGGRARSASTGARSTSIRSSGSAATRADQRVRGSRRRGEDARRPEGGELPPEEELWRWRRPKAEAEAAAAAHAEAHERDLRRRSPRGRGRDSRGLDALDADAERPTPRAPPTRPAEAQPPPRTSLTQSEAPARGPFVSTAAVHTAHSAGARACGRARTPRSERRSAGTSRVDDAGRPVRPRCG